jgi:RHS repeat-associated protein
VGLRNRRRYAKDYNLNQYVDTPRAHEQFGYAYDAAWNLNVRTNNALIQTFNVNTLNELTSATRNGTLTVAGTATEPRGDVSGSALGVTNVTVSGTGLSSGPADIYHEGDWARSGATLADGNNSYTASGQDTYGRTSQDSVSVDLPVTNTFVYDLNGNLCTNNTRIFDYDDENQLIRVTEPGEWKTEFAYDGLLRMRKCQEFAWSGSAWTQTNEVHYVYDGQLVIQERDGNNLSLVTYTRGNDLSGTLQGAGGIGGLLARTDNGQMIGGSPTATALYVADANGNVIRMFYTNGTTAARYNYDPFGNMLTMSGPVATANKYRFSSKEWNGSAGLYYYGFRFYEPSLQRWLNRDPNQELGGVNLIGIRFNDFINMVEPFGLCPEDVQKIHDLYNQATDDMNKAGHRVGWFPPLSSLKYWVPGNGWECVSQAQCVANKLWAQSPNFVDRWDIQTVTSPSGTHTWVEARSHNPFDPKIKLDPWWGNVKNIPASYSNQLAPPISNANANNIPAINVPVPNMPCGRTIWR